MAGFFPVIESTKSSRHSWAMSFRSFPRSREAHFCFTSGFSACKASKDQSRKIPLLYVFGHFEPKWSGSAAKLPCQQLPSLQYYKKTSKAKRGLKFMGIGWIFPRFPFNLQIWKMIKSQYISQLLFAHNPNNKKMGPIEIAPPPSKTTIQQPPLPRPSCVQIWKQTGDSISFQEIDLYLQHVWHTLRGSFKLNGKSIIVSHFIFFMPNFSKSPYHQFFFASSFLFQRHPFFVFFEIFSFSGLQIKPRVGKCFDMGQEGLDEWVELILKCQTRCISN